MIWIVAEERGEYSDYSWSAKRAFTTSAKAEEYVEKMEKRNAIFKALSRKVGQWEAAYRIATPQTDHPTLKRLAPPEGDEAVLLSTKVTTPELKTLKLKIQARRQQEKLAIEELNTETTKAFAAVNQAWYDIFNQARLEFIRTSFAKELQEYEVKEDQLIGYSNWTYEPSWNIYKVPLDSEVVSR